jgi:hypothetical protein
MITKVRTPSLSCSCSILLLRAKIPEATVKRHAELAVFVEDLLFRASPTQVRAALLTGTCVRDLFFGTLANRRTTATFRR